MGHPSTLAPKAGPAAKPDLLPWAVGAAPTGSWHCSHGRQSLLPSFGGGGKSGAAKEGGGALLLEVCGVAT
jgi:hypothetical protein